MNLDQLASDLVRVMNGIALAQFIVFSGLVVSVCYIKYKAYLVFANKEKWLWTFFPIAVVILFSLFQIYRLLFMFGK